MHELRAVPRVAIVTESASLAFGGESSLALSYFSVLRRRGHDAYLVCHERTRRELQTLLSPEDFARVRFAPDTAMARGLMKPSHFLPDKVWTQTCGPLLQLRTQSLQRGLIRQLVAEDRIDLVHQVAPVSPKAPSLMFGLGVPVMMGPMSGGMVYPPAFTAMDPPAARAVEHVGRRLSHLINFLIPGKRNADMLVVANSQTRDALPRNLKGRIEELVEIGVDLQVWKPPAVRAADAVRTEGECRFVFLGRLVDWKALDLLLEALASAVKVAPGLQLEIIGSGPMETVLRAQTTQLALAPHVTFSGWLGPEQASAHVGQADALVLPSLRECGGIVMLEAMALGLPVVATNWGGPRAYLDDEVSIRVDPTSREEFVAGLAAAMVKMAAEPELRQRMGRAAAQRVRETAFNWDNKVDRIIELYQQTIAQAGGRQ